MLNLLHNQYFLFAGFVIGILLFFEFCIPRCYHMWNAVPGWLAQSLVNVICKKFCILYPKEFLELQNWLSDRQWKAKGKEEAFARIGELCKNDISLHCQNFNFRDVFIFTSELWSFRRYGDAEVVKKIKEHLHQLAVSCLRGNNAQIFKRITYKYNSQKQSKALYDIRGRGEVRISAMFISAIPAKCKTESPTCGSDHNESPTQNKNRDIIGELNFHRCGKKHQNDSEHSDSMVPRSYCKINRGFLHAHETVILSHIHSNIASETGKTTTLEVEEINENI